MAVAKLHVDCELKQPYMACGGMCSVRDVNGRGRTLEGKGSVGGGEGQDM